MSLPAGVKGPDPAVWGPDETRHNPVTERRATYQAEQAAIAAHRDEQIRARTQIVNSMVGHTITHTGWSDDTAHLTLDDGRTIRFGSYGYDDWWTTVEETR